MDENKFVVVFAARRQKVLNEILKTGKKEHRITDKKFCLVETD